MLLTINPVHLSPSISTPSVPPFTKAKETGRLPAIQSSRSAGISKESAPRLSTPTAADISNLEALLPEQVRKGFKTISTSSYEAIGKLPSQQSPHQVPTLFTGTDLKESLHWSMPTPPRSDSATATVIPGGSYSYTTTSSVTGLTTTAADMSTLSYMMPSQYGPMVSDDPSSYSSPGYPLDQTYRMQLSQQNSNTNPYDLSGSNSQYAPNQIRNTSPTTTFTSPNQSYHAHNPYGLGYGSMPSSVTRSLSSPMPAATMASTNSNPYAPQYDRSSLYDTSMYAPSQASGASTMPSHSQNLGYSSPPFTNTPPQSFARSMSTTSVGSSTSKVSNHKAKPQCFEHGCNGREFSTFSNLLRHQREKSGSATKSFCPRCGAEFTRTTARNGHLAHDKCSKQRRPSEGK